MDKRIDTPVSEMDDNMLQMHALSVAYRDAERRREEAEKRVEQMKAEARDLEAQMEEMATAYQVLMSKNAGLNAFCRKQQEELESLRKALVEAQASQDTEERGKDV